MKNKYCPNGNYWEEVSSIFDTETYMFCDCNKCNGKMYVLRARDVTKKVSPDVIKRVRSDAKLQDIRQKINKNNMEEVEKILN